MATLLFLLQTVSQTDWGEFLRALSVVLGTGGGILGIIYSYLTQNIKTRADKAEVKADKAEVKADEARIKAVTAETKAEHQQRQISELNESQDQMITSLKRALDESQQTATNSTELNKSLIASLQMQNDFIANLNRKVDELEKKVPRLVREKVTGEFERRDKNGLGNPPTPQPL